MFKKLAIASVLGTAMLGGPGFAQTTKTAQFSVFVELTPMCLFDMTNTAITASYTAFGSAVDADPTSFKVKCTKNTSYTLSLDNNGSYTDTATELNYTLKIGATAEGATAASAGGTGDGANQTFYVTANIPANQAGKAPSGTAVTLSNTRTITVSY